jgi:PAS domain S-box-containing protein
MTGNSTELTLKKIGDFLSKLAERSEDVYWLSSPDFQSIIYLSPAYEKIWGRSREDLYKNPEQWISFLVPEDVKNYNPIYAMATRIAEFGPAARYSESYRIVRPDGQVRWILDRGFPIYNDEGDCCGVTGIAIDMTERKAMEKEAERLQLEKKVLEEQEEVTRLLAASMAHELRTPLRAIQSGAEGLENFLPPLLEGYQAAREAGIELPYIAPMHYNALEKVVKNIQIETRAAFSVIDMLLVKTNLSHLDTGKFKTFSIAQCLEEALERYPLHQDEIEKIHWQKNDFSFYGDEVLMIHVIFNLLKNALHYIKAASKGDIQIWCDKNEKFNILHFKDTSQGIDADILPHIFERFYTRTRHGTGVGLAFCKLVMQSFGGDIACESIKGEYSDFILTFPHKN